MRTMHRLIVFFLLAGLCSIFLSFSPCCAPPAQQDPLAALRKHAEVQENVMVIMRDRVKLATDIAYPKGKGAYPTILIRTPYRKGLQGALGLVRAGYAFVCQDTRGRYGSEGGFYPFIHEGKDGYDTVEWVAAQPWCNGRVGMMGGSYLGATQLLAAMENPPHLCCIAPDVPPTDLEGGTIYHGGALRLELVLGWLLDMNKTSKRMLEGRVTSEERSQWRGSRALLRQRARHLPVKDPGPLVVGGPHYADCWQDFISSWEEPGRWAGQSPVRNPEKIKVPVLMLGGFYDIFAKENIAMLDALRRSGGSEKARAHSHLLMGPWVHALGAPSGERNFTAAHSILRELRKNWFDHWLKDRDTGADEWPVMRFFVMNRDQWIETDAWPPTSAEPRQFFLHSEGLEDAPSETGSGKSEFIYDPDRPVDTQGGCNLTISQGIEDQRNKRERDDVLAFFSEPFESDLTVAGPMKVRLFVSSSAPDTDFCAMVVDAEPGGYEANVADGIVRLRYRAGRGKPLFVKPGQCAEVFVECWSTAWTFKKGHALGVYVSSSNFPRFDRNLNTDEPMGEGVEVKKARNTVFHDLTRPSALEVFVLDLP